MLIVHVPGMCPRIGYLNPADELASMREWQAANPGASIYVVRASIDLPSPGTAWVDTIEQAIHNEEWAQGPSEDEWPDSEMPEEA